MNNYCVIGSFCISPNLKQVSLNKYVLNLEKVFSNIKSYLKFNDLISNPCRNNIISYIFPDYNIKIYKNTSSYLLDKFKNIKITIYYSDKKTENKTLLSSTEYSSYIIKSKRLKFLSADQTLTLSSSFSSISRVVITGLLLNSNNFKHFQASMFETNKKKLLKEVLTWFTNSHIYSINSLVEILENLGEMPIEEKIDLIRSEMVSITSDFINSSLINEVCNKLEKNIFINKI